MRTSPEANMDRTNVDPALADCRSLDQVPAGSTAIVVEVHRSGETREHLAARGIAPGVPVRVLKAGDPLLVAVDQSRWAIGKEHARAVAVLVEEDVSR
jgi:Fe2+ transport system protein FeoA